ncbi:nose resistant to fluoxetine protein 6-like [Schistocerca americana]|uniref:nose resistant to fluoxetine protein 6-like n=1 Tax=Schistocerca americana TaxID=7009 RepID=UPI001F50091E|nr:nose resistant to fluoxetine protein 6-like [Schistocerca americana]
MAARERRHPAAKSPQPSEALQKPRPERGEARRGEALSCGRRSSGASDPPTFQPPAKDVLVAALLPPLAPGEAAPASDVGGACRQHAALYRTALQQLQPWAMRMYDASAKLSGGVLTGAVSQLGQLEECLAVRGPASTAAPPPFAGRHCTASLSATLLPLTAAPPPAQGSLRELILAVAAASDMDVQTLTGTVTYKWSFCVPSTCSATDVEAELAAKLSPLSEDPTANISLSVPPSTCLSDADTAEPLSPELIAFLCLVALLAAVVVIGTALDVFAAREMQPPRWRRAACAFSLRASWNTLFNAGGGSGGGRFESFDGVRVLSILWIVLGHTYYMTAVQPLVNSIEIVDWHEMWYRMPVMNGTVSTDSFFVLGAALLAMGFLRERERRQERGRRLGAELCRAAALRYVRLTPPYALVVFFYAAALQRLGTGPLWDSVVGPEVNFCRHSWWVNMLYLNNYLHLDQPCMNQTWYLAVDMQLFLVGLLLLTAVWLWPRAAPFGLLAALVVAVVTPLAIAAAYDLTGSMLYATDDAMLWQVFSLLYTPSHTRAGPYIVGLGLGYTLHRLKGKQLRLTVWQEVALWAASGAVWVLAVPSALPLYGRWPAVPQPWSALYAGLQRPLWSLALAWMLLACCKGRARPLQWLLGLPLFRPLSALVYCVYLTHYALLIYVDGSVRTAGFLSDFGTIQSAIGVLVTSLGVSLVLHLTVELPTVALSKEFLRPPPPTGTNQARATAVSKGGVDSRAEEHAVDVGCYENQGLDLSLDKQGPSQSSTEATASQP